MKQEWSVINALGKLPGKLAEMYAIVYEQISESDPEDLAVAKRVLKWLLCAQRPLHNTELIAAISLSTEGQRLKLSNRQVLDICCNLVVLDKEIHIFRFAHLSVREYLESREDYTEYESHRLAAERCVDTLISELTSKLPLESMVKQDSVLRHYATLYWPVHCERSGSDQIMDGLKNKVRQFLLQGRDVTPSFTKWISDAEELCRPLRWRDPLEDRLKDRLREISSLPPTPLFLACSFGLIWILDDLGTFENVDWNQRNKGGTPGIHLAAWRGHEAVVRLLLDRGADVDAKDEYGWTALRKVAVRGREAVVQQLLDRGADVNARTNERRTALRKMTEKRHEAVVQLLLDLGADINARDKYG
jgi:hypothetical protein